MVYSALVKKACCMMFEAHKEDTDKGGYPYVFHPFFLATQMDEESAACVALLHDVIEDHPDQYSLSDLRGAGFPDEVLEALALLTHDDAVPYMEYVKKLAVNPIAAKVKLADLKHNLDIRRVDGKRTKKHELYEEAVRYLSQSLKP